MSADTPQRPRGAVYEVGFGRPPVHSRFQPGQSGNPHGRPKGQEVDLAGAIAKELKQPVTLTENGQRRRLTKGELIAKQLVNKAAGGDLRAISVIQKLDTKGPVATDPGQNNQATQQHAGRGSNFDFASMPTEDLEIIMQACWLLEGRETRPAVPLPPTGPPKI